MITEWSQKFICKKSVCERNFLWFKLILKSLQILRPWRSWDKNKKLTEFSPSGLKQQRRHTSTPCTLASPTLQRRRSEHIDLAKPDEPAESESDVTQPELGEPEQRAEQRVQSDGGEDLSEQQHEPGRSSRLSDPEST